VSKRKGNEETLKTAIERLMKVYKLESKMSEVNIVNSWEKLMGKTIASKTEEIFIRDKKLFIRLSSSVLRQELSYAKSKIVELINKEAGTEIVSEVILK
jgi:predicted nucleic acid-binding Zn ribbon protein